MDKAVLKLLKKRIPFFKEKCDRCGVSLTQDGVTTVIHKDNPAECLCHNCHNMEQKSRYDFPN